MDLKYCPKCGHQLKKKKIKENERMYCRYCDKVYYDNPIPSVAVVIRNEENQLLLVKRKVEPQKGYWSLPGGFMDDGESAIQAALRELEEETGFKGIINRFIKIYNHESQMYGHVIIITYEVSITGGQMKAGDDAECVNFFDIGKLPALAFGFQKEAITEVTGCLLSKKDK